MKPMRLIPLLLALTVLLSACSSRDPLDGTAWQLDAYRKTLPIEGTTITLAFEDGEVSGVAGCNLYGGQYEIKRSEISFEQLYATEMYCLDPEGVMQQEADYLEYLGAAQRYELQDGQLLIYFSEHEALTFVPKESGSLTAHSVPIEPLTAPRCIAGVGREQRARGLAPARYASVHCRKDY